MTIAEMQLDFFQPEISEIDCLRTDFKNVKESADKVRKSLYARHGELARKYAELHERMQILERYICQGQLMFAQYTPLDTNNHTIYRPT